MCKRERRDGILDELARVLFESEHIADRTYSCPIGNLRPARLLYTAGNNLHWNPLKKASETFFALGDRNVLMSVLY